MKTKTLLLITAAVCSACAVVPAQKQQYDGGFHGTKIAQFAVFAQDGSVTAIKTGTEPMNGFEFDAIHAIKQATGCAVVMDTLTTDFKSATAQLSC